MTPGTVLVLAAHADDEVLGCGGTIRRFTAEGRRVVVALLTDGVSSRAGASSLQAASRAQQAADAARELGHVVTPWQPDGHGTVPDNEADTVSRLALARMAEGLVRAYRPAVVLTHSMADLNVDHRRAHEAALLACRPLPAQCVREIYAFEVPSSTEWGLRPFAPALYMDISQTLEAKLEAMSCYGAEQPPFPHPRSQAALRALAVLRGAQCGVAAAEAYEVIRVCR